MQKPQRLSKVEKEKPTTFWLKVVTVIRCDVQVQCKERHHVVRTALYISPSLVAERSVSSELTIAIQGKLGKKAYPLKPNHGRKAVV